MDTLIERVPLVSVTTFSLQDFPGKAACILWFTGCQMRCPYCHNPDFALGKGERIDLTATLDFLRKRRKLLDGVTFSGGECLLSPAIIPMVRAVKDLGYAVKIDTNGGMPDRLVELLLEDLIDYVALDFKAPFDAYERVTGWGQTELWKRSFAALRSSGVDFELRTTVYPGLLDEDDVGRMMDWLEEEGFDGALYLQHFQNAPQTLGSLADPERRFDLRRLQFRRPFSTRFRNFTARETRLVENPRAAAGVE